MKKISVIVPTVTGREDYLVRCLDGYMERTEGAEIEPIVLIDRPSGGIAWQEGAERATGDYIHLTNDDIVPGFGWAEPCMEVVDDLNGVPVILICWCTAEVLDPETMMPFPDNPHNQNTNHFEKPGVRPDFTHASRSSHSEYPSLPFCSREQWKNIGPMIPTQYGTDKWFGWRAKKAGYANICRSNSICYHYAASKGRDYMIDGWLGQDRLVFDHNIAYPLYRSGDLALDELHPEWNTNKGREIARAWWNKNLPNEPKYWELEWLKS